MRFILRILSWIYGAGVWLRNMLYDEHVLHSFKPSIPTICVGNLAVGGTGKTPHVEYLVRILQENGYVVAVLSRGYKRRSVGFVEANKDSTAASIGDEAMQMKLKFPDLIVAVCEDRFLGIRRLQRLHPDLQVVLLDDAFQHRRLRAGYYILLTQADRLYVEDDLLPLGRLRESAQGSLRADMIVVTKCPDNVLPIDLRIIDNKLHVPPSQSLLFSRMSYLDLVGVFDESHKTSKINKINRVLLLTGIAQPHYLLEHVKSLAAEVYSLDFPDHHAFTEEDIRRIERAFDEEHCDFIITTEKDAVRLRESASFPERLKPHVFAQPIETVFLNDDKQTFNSNILHYVGKSKSDR